MSEFNFWNYLLGIDDPDLDATQMILRATIVYVATIAMIRIGERRVLGKNTAFDVILGVVLGSSLSRAINGNASLMPTIFAGFMLIVLHWSFASLSYHHPWFGRLVKGRPLKLVSDGERIEKNFARAHITERDLEEAARRRAGSDPDEADEIRLERSGEISFVSHERDQTPDQKPQPRILDIAIADGVQTVRVELM
ncbi:MAG: DUF421 domain-containing protein [Acidobacteria bacterium]|nr:DUF421 domain-containing protein [Acidobacteriota bacterium]